MQMILFNTIESLFKFSKKKLKSEFLCSLHHAVAFIEKSLSTLYP